MLLATPSNRLLNKIVHHRSFTSMIIILILINAILVGIETYPTIYHKHYEILQLVDKVILWLFTIEIILRIFAARLLFFTDGWNWFDFIIVACGHLFVGAQFVTVLRILRVMRVLRATSVIPSLRKLTDALLLTIPSLGSILVLMGIIFYIFAVVGTMLFSQVAPEYFGNLELSLLTLFQVVTLDSWASGVMRPIFSQSLWSWLYFVIFVLVGTFVIFNLFVGVIVNNVEKANQNDEQEEKTDELAEIRKEIAELKLILLTNQIASTRDQDKKSGSPN